MTDGSARQPEDDGVGREDEEEGIWEEGVVNGGALVSTVAGARVVEGGEKLRGKNRGLQAAPVPSRAGEVLTKSAEGGG